MSMPGEGEKTATGGQGVESSLEKIFEVIDRETGFEVEYYDEKHLERRISARMHRTSASNYREYLDLLRKDNIEQSLLIEQLSVNVTGFFRDPDVWSSIGDVVERIDEPIEAWSAACSDGREPYSLSMLLDSKGIEHETLATDIDPESLETAYKGVYESLRTNDIADQVSEFDPSMLRYLSEDEKRYEVTGIKENVRFREHDLVADGPVPPKDLVMCRNLFIYIDEEYRDEVYETLYESLKEGGYLIIGKSESVPRSMRSDFETVDSENRIYARL
jgi:chemotaxis protein methyltransferase CheR